MPLLARNAPACSAGVKSPSIPPSDNENHSQLKIILILIGVQLWIVGIVADIVAVNRRLLEDIQVRVKRLEYR